MATTGERGLGGAGETSSGMAGQRGICKQAFASSKVHVLIFMTMKYVMSETALQIFAQNAIQRSVDILQITSTASSGLVPSHIVKELKKERLMH